MSLIDIHSRLGNTALYYMIIMALWGGWRYFRRQGVDSSYWGAMVIAEILFFAQGSLGAYLYLSGIGQLAGHTIHILYGVVSLLVLPAVYMYTRGDEQRRASLVYSVSFLFLIGIVLRAITTAAG
jgi:hypothetical protein